MTSPAEISDGLRWFKTKKDIGQKQLVKLGIRENIYKLGKFYDLLTTKL